jgi:UDP-3-O-[3-hydroxymyristoyl] glucosamine N-acyltransferase
VTIAGQAGIVGHVTIGDNAQIGAQAGENGAVPAGAHVLGAPAAPIGEARRRYGALQKLPEMRGHLRALEREVAELRRQVAELQARAAASTERSV